MKGKEERGRTLAGMPCATRWRSFCLFWNHRTTTIAPMLRTVTPVKMRLLRRAWRYSGASLACARETRQFGKVALELKTERAHLEQVGCRREKGVSSSSGECRGCREERRTSEDVAASGCRHVEREQAGLLGLPRDVRAHPADEESCRDVGRVSEVRGKAKRRGSSRLAA